MQTIPLAKPPNLSVNLDKIPLPKKDLSLYRPDLNNKFGGGDGMETLPIKLDKQKVLSFVQAAAANNNSNNITPEDLLALLTKEGRSDFGLNPFISKKNGSTQINTYDTNIPGNTEKYKDLISKGFSPQAAGFSITLENKMNMAKKLGISFGEAWNGTGTNKYGTKGKQYGEELQAFKNSNNYKKNAALLNEFKSIFNKVNKK